MSALSLPITCLDSDNHCHRNSAADPPQLDGYDDYWDGAYSKPFVVLDFVWNLAFVLVSVFVLLTTIREKPCTPLRVWIAGYSSLSLLHVGFVYQRINHTVFGYQRDGLLSSHSLSSTVKRLESMNAVISSIWWVFGFYWIVMGGQTLLQDSPRLYWLAVVFLAFDVFFVIFCIVIASVVFFALFCCLPVVAAVAYAMTITEGASEDDIRTLPKYKYRQANPLMSSGNNRKQEPVELIIESGSSNSMPELALHPDDSECCICLHQYVEGSELCSLPCKHHFHCACISKWLRINATCPLCKLDILRGDSLV